MKKNHFMHDETLNFYQNLWSVISSQKGEFYSDSLGNLHDYAELKHNVLKCCEILREHQQVRIAVLCSKNFYNYSAILGVLFSENVWVPLSPSTPVDRNLEILQDLNADILITDLPNSSDISKKASAQHIDVLTVDSIFKRTAVMNSQPRLANKPEDLSMIYYTSGSTGKPKGVMIKNESFVNNIKNIMNILEPENLRFIDLHDLSFVISIPTIFPCILSRSQLFSANSEIDILFPGNTISRENINIVITVPSTLKRIVAEKRSNEIISSLDYVISCGEPLNFDLLASYLTNEKLKFFNFYGSTEVAPWIFCHECTQSTLEYESRGGFVPVGSLLAGNEMAIRDDGMLLIRGVQVTPGYVGHKANDHLIEYKGSLWFPMQDAIEKHDDIFFCKGRIDGLLKIKGYRVHLSDIEVNFKKINGVQECVCFVDKEKIIAFVFTNTITDPKSILEEARHLLPSHMIPSKIMLETNIPFNKNGKVDRAKIKQKL